jgi:hypothetical protein
MAERALPIFDTQAEKEEYDAVLQSSLINRSPSLLRIAQYIGRKYFEGDAGSLKEYNIAVEALGKSSGFDPKKDSIVRVEAHRLRKKFDEYYQTEGRNHYLRVIVRPGQYIPEFIPQIPPPPVITPRTDSTSEDDASVTEIPPAAPLPSTPSAWLRPFPVVLLLVVATSLALGPLLYFQARSHDHVTDPPVRIAAGATTGSYTVSASGFNWRTDSWFSGGTAVVAERARVNYPDASLHSQRQGDFDYNIPLQPGPYELRLFFAPRLAGGNALDPVQTRRFDVLANGAKIMDSLDPSAAMPHPNEWIVRVFRGIAAASDGRLHLSFRSRVDFAYVSGIELTAGDRRRLLPLRMVAKASSFTDSSGRVWGFERFVEGGTLVTRTARFPKTLDPNLYSGERYGSFSYKIPVARGRRYTLRLHFSETWFDPALGQGGVGSRRFDVYANGIPLLEDFDIMREAGGPYKPIIKEFYDLRPDLEGYIVLSFLPRVNFACINALELLDETR